MRIVVDGVEKVQRERGVKRRCLHLGYLGSGINAGLGRYFGRIEPQGGIEYLTGEVAQSGFLPFGWHYFVRHFARHVVDITPTDVLSYVSEVAHKLLSRAVIHLAQVYILVVGLARPLGQVLDKPLKVLHAIVASLHIVVA